MIKYECDKCKKQTEDRNQILDFRIASKDTYGPDIFNGSKYILLCHDCRKLIDDFIWGKQND